MMKRSYSDKYKVNHLNIDSNVISRSKGSNRRTNAEGLAVVIAFFLIISAVTFGAVVFGISV